MANDTICLYQQIIDYIMDKINKGYYSPTDRLPTEHELSQKFSVSRITSKKALDELAARGVITRHRRLGSFLNSDYTNENDFNNTVFMQNNTIKNGSAKKLIGLVFPIDTNLGDMMLYVKGVLDYITLRGYYLIISNSNRNSEKEKEVLTTLINDEVRGIIYYPFSDRHNFSLMKKLRMENYPIVLIDKYFTGIDIPYVVSDNQTGAKMITKHLIDNGHKRIAFFSENEVSEYSTIRERYAGYCEALNESGIQIEDSLLFEYIIKNYNESTEEYINDVREPVKKAISNNATAIFCPSDGMAINVITACMSMNINVPEDISVTGFDDLIGSGQFYVPLTTVRQDLYQMGHEAAKMLLRLLEGKQTKKSHISPVDLIIRSSVKDLNQ